MAVLSVHSLGLRSIDHVGRRRVGVPRLELQRHADRLANSQADQRLHGSILSLRHDASDHRAIASSGIDRSSLQCA
jgi:hypothetical protein